MSTFLRGAIWFGYAVQLLMLPSGASALPPNYFFQPATNLGPAINSSFDEFNPDLSRDGLTLVLSTNRSGGLGATDLWQSTRESFASPWTLPVWLGPQVNSTASDATPSLSADGLTLFIQSSRAGGFGDWDLWQSTRASTSSPWGVATNMGSLINSSAIDASPELSADGLTLYFMSTRPGGVGNHDLWQVTRSSPQASWGTPQNLGSPVNTPFYESAATITSDGLTLYFDSNNPTNGLGDLWYSVRESTSDPWNRPERLDAAINSSDADIVPTVSPDGRTLIFRSDRPGGLGGQDLWTATAVPAFAFSRFNEPTTGNRDYSSAGSEIGFQTTVLNANTGAGTQELGVVLGSGGAELRMRTVHAATSFDTVDLAAFEDVIFSIDVRNTSTSWEVGDFVRVELRNGNKSIIVLDAAGTSALDAIEGTFRNYRVSIPNDWPSAQIYVESFSNSSVGEEVFDFDNIAFFGTHVVPEPNTIGLAAFGIVLLTVVKRRYVCSESRGRWRRMPQ